MKIASHASFLALLLVTPSAVAATTNYKATIDVKQVVPAPSAPPASASGVALLTFDDTTKVLCGTVTYQGLTGPATGVHIHVGEAGSPVSGAGAQEIEGSLESPLEVDVKLSAGNVAKLGASGLYINFHTDKNANGEIRGQIVPDPSGTVQPCAGGAPDAGGETSSGSDVDAGVPSGAATSEPKSTPASSSCNVSRARVGGRFSLAALAVGALVFFSRRKTRLKFQ